MFYGMEGGTPDDDSVIQGQVMVEVVQKKFVSPGALQYSYDCCRKNLLRLVF